VRTAYDGKEGSKAIQEKKPDAIVLDVMMATLTEGFDLAHYLKADPEYRDIPIIMVTGFPREMARVGPEKFQSVLGDEWPVAKFFEKPVDSEKIVAAVEDALKEAKGHESVPTTGTSLCRKWWEIRNRDIGTGAMYSKSGAPFLPSSFPRDLNPGVQGAYAAGI